MKKKILLVVDWNELEMDFAVPVIYRSEFGSKVNIWNCKRKVIFTNLVLQRYYEYLGAVLYVICNHRKYRYIVLWQQIIGFMIGLLPFSSITNKTIISTVLYSDRNTKESNVKNYIFRKSIKRVGALLYYSEEMSNETKLDFPKYSEKIFSTFIPILFSTDVNLSVSKFANIIDSNRTIFCGGRSDRDFESVILAFKNTSIPVVIVCPDEHHISNLNLVTENIKVLRFSQVPNDEYYDLVKRSFCTMIPLRSEDSSCGQLLFSFAMNNEKPIIASDSQGVRDYIENKKNGLLVPVKNHDALKDAYELLLEDSKLRYDIIDKSKEIADKMTVTNYLEKTFQIIELLPN